MKYKGYTLHTRQENNIWYGKVDNLFLISASTLEGLEKLFIDNIESHLKYLAKSQAYLVVKRIQDGDNNFDSPYTKSTNPDNYTIMKVDEDRIMNDLSQEEKLLLSEVVNKIPILNIWTRTYVYILDKWFLVSEHNTFNSNFSYNPNYIRLDSDYLFDVEAMELFKLVEL